jgi:Fic family protein
MVSISKKTIEGHTYYYLEHSYREQGKVTKKTRYLGKTVPSNIEQLKEELLTKVYHDLWFTKFDNIKKQYTNEQKTLPPSIEQKQQETFSIRFTYNTNKIEGSTLTLRETALLLELGITPSRRPIEDVKETETHQHVFQDMLSYTKEVTLSTLLHWHKQLFEETKKDEAGKLRDYPVGIAGSTYQPPYPIELDLLLTAFFDWYKKQRAILHPVYVAALVHLKIVTIHPFGDGNGRISRLFMNYVLHKHGYPMIVIDYTDRNSYYHALERSQVKNDDSIFTQWFFKRYLKEYKKYLL